MCTWFALCTRPAQYLISHPANRGGVPTCEPCYTKLLTLSDGRVADDVIAERTP